MKKFLPIILLLIMLLTGCTQLKTYILIDNKLVECTILERGTIMYLIQYEYNDEVVTTYVWESEVHSIDPKKISY